MYPRQEPATVGSFVGDLRSGAQVLSFRRLSFMQRGYHLPAILDRGNLRSIIRDIRCRLHDNLPQLA